MELMVALSKYAEWEADAQHAMCGVYSTYALQIQIT